MTILLFIVFCLLPMFAVPALACIVHDIRWSRQLAASNARNAAERAQYKAQAAWEAERDAVIAAIEKRNQAMARFGGNSMVFEGIPEKYREVKL